MWSYYGSKTNIVDRYPKPQKDKIKEPFAGTARYSLKYFDREITLVDSYEIVVRIWHWLQKCSPKDVLSLQIPAPGKTTHDYVYDCIEQKWLVGFIISYAQGMPMISVSQHYQKARKGGVIFKLNDIASNLWKIRHWKIIHGDYTILINEDSTWFIDPPYQHSGHKYVKSNKHIDFPKLAVWCQERAGQTIVCENNKADWLPFKPMVTQKTKNGTGYEVIWTNEPTHYNNIQTSLFHEQL